MSSAGRVLQVVQPPDGGVAEHALLLSLGLKRRGWEVEVAASADSVIRPALRSEGIRVHLLPLRRELDAHDLRAAVALRALQRKRGYDLVNAHSSKAGALARAVLPANAPVVYTPHCPPFAAPVGRLERLAYLGVEQALVPRSGAIVAVCEWERTIVERALWAAAGRTRVIRNGVPPCPEVEPDHTLVDFKGDRPLVGLVSVLRPQKDPVTAIRAATLLASRGVEARFAIVGNGMLRPWVEAEIRSLGVSEQVRWFPFRGPPARYLRALDVFLLPSLWEALPLGIIEAMNCGLPVIATRVGGVPELVEGGVTGKLVPAGDVEAFASAVEELLADPGRRRSMGEEGRAVAATRFGVDRMVEETEALFLELLGSSADTVTP